MRRQGEPSSKSPGYAISEPKHKCETQVTRAVGSSSAPASCLHAPAGALHAAPLVLWGLDQLFVAPRNTTPMSGVKLAGTHTHTHKHPNPHLRTIGQGLTGHCSSTGFRPPFPSPRPIWRVFRATPAWHPPPLPSCSPCGHPLCAPLRLLPPGSSSSSSSLPSSAYLTSLRCLRPSTISPCCSAAACGQGRGHGHGHWHWHWHGHGHGHGYGMGMGMGVAWLGYGHRHGHGQKWAPARGPRKSAWRGASSIYGAPPPPGRWGNSGSAPQPSSPFLLAPHGHCPPSPLAPPPVLAAAMPVDTLISCFLRNLPCASPLTGPSKYGTGIAPPPPSTQWLMRSAHLRLMRRHFLWQQRPPVHGLILVRT